MTGRREDTPPRVTTTHEIVFQESDGRHKNDKGPRSSKKENGKPVPNPYVVPRIIQDVRWNVRENISPGNNSLVDLIVLHIHGRQKTTLGL